MTSRSRNAVRPRLARNLAPLREQRGRREDRGARCTRGLVCKVRKRKRTRAYRFSGGIRPSLRNGFTAYFVLSPVNGFLATVIRRSLASRELDASTAASGPHDFAVPVTRLRLLRVSRPPHLTARS